MDLLSSVLVDIKGGKRSFAPTLLSPLAIADFQPIAQRLQSAHRNGLIADLRVRSSKMRDSHGSVLGALVRGGLTFEGEQFLAALQRPPELESVEPVIRLKPTVWGMSIDLDALAKRVFRKIKSR